MQIVPGDLDDPRIIALLETHMRTMLAQTPSESVYALDLSGLKQPQISFLAVWDADQLLGVGALKELAADHGEIKSMHVPVALRGRGIASMLLKYIIALAQSRGYARLSLETGNTDHFEPARSLYAAHGFEPCGPFGDYAFDPHSAYMTRTLQGA